MQRLKLLIIVFSIALSIPLAFFVLQTYRGLEQEEVATLRYFAEALFDEMETALGSLVQREEGRAVDEYNFWISAPLSAPGLNEKSRSPLSNLPAESFILGYFQNNPDGSFQTPLVANDTRVPPHNQALVDQLKGANLHFNRKRATVTDTPTSAAPAITAAAGKKPSAGFADKYVDLSRMQESKDHLGQKEKRVEKITVTQAQNIAAPEQLETMRDSRPAEERRDHKSRRIASESRIAAAPPLAKTQAPVESFRAQSDKDLQPPSADRDVESGSFQVEVAPLQSVFLAADQIYIFRRIMINHQIYRQGFILKTDSFLDYLANTYFSPQPMAQYSNLRLAVADQGREISSIEAGVRVNGSGVILNRTFPSPFSFLHATITCAEIPRSAGRRTLNFMMIVLAVIVLLGLFAIYRNARAVIDLSERRSQFVSSVTHELKTPLTNIRMYIEMLAQGIAQDPEREREYFRILESEGARLSRLINNVLELSKLEKNQRRMEMQIGTCEEVLAEIQTIMHAKLRQEGFGLTVDKGPLRAFCYDREAMIQVLINLIENSMKFGKSADQRQITIRIHQDAQHVHIAVADTGPGIPDQALKRVFDDFYRVDNSLTRTTRGTGIGLALVKKLVTMMGGTVAATNNVGPGCTITISLPREFD